MLFRSSVFSIELKPGKKEDSSKPEVVNHLKGKIAKLSSWETNPMHSIFSPPDAKKPYDHLQSLILTATALGLILAPLAWFKRIKPLDFSLGVLVLFLLSVFAFLLASQKVIKDYNFEYVLWALFTGILISNTVGVPGFLKPMLIGDSIIKVGLICLGAEVLFYKLMLLGLPGILLSWVVTPIVLITTFWFGQRVLKIDSPSLNMVISADMSVCGVSAAIATGAACNAKREEISYAIGVSLFFTAMMMVVQPILIKQTGMNPIVGAAWIGGTIDSTGAVVAAGELLGKEAQTVAVSVKTIQNVLIGVIALAVATYWTATYGREKNSSSIGIAEIWKRFPKFVLGFIGASIAFSMLPSFLGMPEAAMDTLTKDSTSTIRTWLFCIAFVALGLEINFREVGVYLAKGKPLLLYVLGQSWSMILSLAMAYFIFGYLFADQLSELIPKK